MIKSFLKKFNDRISRNSKEDKFSGLKSTGNLITGVNCDLHSLNINAYQTEDNFPNVTIGNDCFLQCTIVLHTASSKVNIGNRVFIGPNTTLFCFDEITIADDVMFSWGCTLIDTNAHSLKSEERMNDVLDWKKGWQYKNWNVVESKKISIEPKCWVGFNSIIMKGVTLKEGSVVAAGSVVTKDTEPYDIIGGNPAKFIKKTV